ncbi:hypothetical protein Glove_116g20 [Diversispora epigaea]|uniref:Uncharacterized protein n=1 Tax=Diversispora epigaea TaxID=1348612 RepID=A0A397J9P3_9GLOM|nr:hypothetical protein Glove_116g20 [Diversispora epigaea]
MTSKLCSFDSFKWILAWRNETKDLFSVVLKEIQTSKFSIRNFDHNTVIESLVEFPSITLIYSLDARLPDNNNLRQENKDEIFLINLTSTENNTTNQTVSIISAADIVLDSVRNNILIPYISSYRNYKNIADELEQALALRANDLGIFISPVTINKEENSESEDYLSENSRNSYSSEETHDSFEAPVDPFDDHSDFPKKKNTHPLVNSNPSTVVSCTSLSASMDTQQLIGNESGERANIIINKATTPKHKRNRRVQQYIFSSKYLGQSDPELIVDDTVSPSPSPINPQPTKRNKRSASSPLYPQSHNTNRSFSPLADNNKSELLKQVPLQHNNNINNNAISEGKSDVSMDKHISHSSHDQMPPDHGGNSYGNSKESPIVDYSATPNSDTNNNISKSYTNNFPILSNYETGKKISSNNEDDTDDLLISDIAEDTHLSNDCQSKDNKEYNYQPCSNYMMNNEKFFHSEEEVYKELETFANTLSSPELFASYIIDLQYVEPPVQATPFEIFNKFVKKDKEVFRNLKSSYHSHLQHHRKSSFLHQYDMAVYKWEISKEQLDLSATFSILQQKYMESKPPLDSYLEGLVKILRKNLNRYSSIQYGELDIINETVKQYQAGKRVNTTLTNPLRTVNQNIIIIKGNIL